MILELLGLKRHCIKERPMKILDNEWLFRGLHGFHPFNRFDTRDSLFVARVTEQQLHLR